jgi:siroheme synthase-like protein
VLDGRRVLIVGGGPVAARKVAILKPSGARITVVAPEAVSDLADDDTITWHRRPYQRGEAASYRLVVSCTGDTEVDRQVYYDGEAAGVWVNSGAQHSSCLLPAVLRRGPVTVAIGTDGASPALASSLRRRIGADLDDAVIELATLVGEVRAELKAAAGSTDHPAWPQALDAGGPDGEPLLDLVKAGRIDEAADRLRSALGLLVVAGERT